VPIVRGRDFTVKDAQRVKHGPDKDDWSPTTIIINEAFARKFFAGRNPIGLHIGFGSDPGTKTDMEVIGVVKDIKYTNLRDEIPVQAFVPYLADEHVGGMTVYLRASVDASEIMSIVRQKVRRLDPSIPVYGMRTTKQQLDLSLRTERLVAGLSSVFGFLATLLAVIGLYGVMAYTVARRTREIGIRMALGAVQANVIWMVMREVLAVVAAGVAIGIPAAVGLSLLVRSQLYGLSPHDPATLVLAAFALAAVACVAGFIPAFRASRIDPTQALRYE
jgi:predicted permease